MRKFFLLLFILWGLASAPSLGALAPWVMRISCGARVNVYTPPRNTLWYKDFAYTGGVPFNATRPSSITPPLTTLRYFPMSSGPNNCYNIRRVPTGHYAVRVFFGLVGQEIVDDDTLFDISIEGTQTCSLLPGWSIYDDETFSESQVFLMDGEASICFHSTGHGDPAIISIEILQIGYGAYYFGLGWGQSVILRTVTRLSCGNGKPMFDVDYGGDSWGGDRFWAPIKTFGQGSDQAVSTEITIMQASNVPNFYPAALYQTAIVSTDTQPDLTYVREVESNGTYSIWFHFAEIDNSIRSIGERVFDILINGNVVFGGVDIVKMSGDRYTALVLNTTVAVDGRSLTITLRPKPGSHAIINAIEVFEILTAEAKTLPEEVATLQSLKSALGLPLRFGWNGDPCVPQQHPWSGADCQFDRTSGKWFIDGLGLDDQGLSGFLPNGISGLGHLQTVNLSSNSILGAIPASIGNVTGLEVVDLSHNFFNGSIPESLGQLTSLQKLNLNGNSLSGRVPAALGGMLLHGASFNFTDNAGLCGMPGLPACGPHLTAGAKTGIAFGTSAALLLVVIFSVVSYKRRQNIIRAQQATARGAPYAKARTQLSQDIQTTSSHDPGHAQTASGNGMGTASHHDRTTIT